MLTGCSAMVKSTQRPYSGPTNPPAIVFGGLSGDTPWATVRNGLNYRVIVKVNCPGRMVFNLPARTEQPFFCGMDNVAPEDRVCQIVSWEIP